jgi:hypothetical protein
MFYNFLSFKKLYSFNLIYFLRYKRFNNIRNNSYFELIQNSLQLKKNLLNYINFQKKEIILKKKIINLYFFMKKKFFTFNLINTNNFNNIIKYNKFNIFITKKNSFLFKGVSFYFKGGKYNMPKKKKFDIFVLKYRRRKVNKHFALLKFGRVYGKINIYKKNGLFTKIRLNFIYFFNYFIYMLFNNFIKIVYFNANKNLKTFSKSGRYLIINKYMKLLNIIKFNSQKSKNHNFTNLFLEKNLFIYKNNLFKHIKSLWYKLIFPDLFIRTNDLPISEKLEDLITLKYNFYKNKLDMYNFNDSFNFLKKNYFITNFFYNKSLNLKIYYFKLIQFKEKVDSFYAGNEEFETFRKITAEKVSKKLK